jgi:hypothetical protein
MRHRLGGASHTGFGNSAPEILNNTGVFTEEIKKLADDAIDIYFKEFGGCDYEITENKIVLGIEPAYQFEELRILCLTKEKNNCYIETGHAFDSYGSGIRSRRKYYGEYKYNSKFKKFIDKWHYIIFSELNNKLC